MAQYIHQAWPSWRYGPKGEAEVFQKAEDVPKGWQDHPSKFKAKAKPEGKDEGDEDDDDKGDADLGGLTREQIIADLTRRGVAFKASASDKTLYRKLLATIEATS